MLDKTRKENENLLSQVMKSIKENEIRFISLQFVDILGIVKSVTVPVSQLEDCVNNGKWFDGSSVEGFTRIAESDMFLLPDLSTFKIIPWEDKAGNGGARVICWVCMPDGEHFEGDPRYVLAKVMQEAEELGYSFNTGPELEFFLFKKDDLITDSTITVSNILYATKVLPIHSKELLAIALKEQKNDLSDEVVVRGYVARKKDSTTGSSFIVSGKEVADVPVGKVEQLLQGKVAGLNIQNNTGAPGMRGSKNVRAMAQSHPMDGWDHYYMYLANNNKFKDKPRLGRSVELTFAVDTAGHAQSIKVFKGISSKYDKEAIRLIKEGPSWLQPEPVNSRISFKIDF